MRSLAVLLAATLNLGAQIPPPRAHSPGCMAQVLGLSLEQQAQMKAIREKHQVVLRADREASRAQARAFRATLRNPEASEAQLRQGYDRMTTQRFRTLLDRRALRQELRAVLTPEQQAKADAMRAEFRKRVKARMEQRRAAWKEQEPPQEP